MPEDLTVSAACRIATHLRTLRRCYPDGQFPNPERKSKKKPAPQRGRVTTLNSA